MKKMIGVLAVCCAAVACGGSDISTVCEKEAACATKAGQAFSKTKCEDTLTQDSEQAQTAGCSNEYQAFADCVANAVSGASCESLQDTQGFVTSECGAQEKKLSTCLGQ